MPERSIIDEDKKKLKKQSNIMKIMMKMNTISNNNEKENEFHNIILPYINQTEKKNDKQKILKCSLRKKNENKSIHEDNKIVGNESEFMISDSEFSEKFLIGNTKNFLNDVNDSVKIKNDSKFKGSSSKNENRDLKIKK